MKIYIIRNDQKDIQLVTSSCDDALNMLNNNKDLTVITYEVSEPETNLRSLSDFSEREYSPLHFYSEIKFGKYKGKQVGDLILECPEYLQWAINNINLKLDEECMTLLNDSTNKNEGVKND